MVYCLLLVVHMVSNAQQVLAEDVLKNRSAERIEKHIRNLNEINKLLNNDGYFFNIFLTEAPFHHELMSCCISIMRKEERLDAFKDIWKFYIKHKLFISHKTDVFLRESCILLLTLYEYCLIKYQKGMLSDMSTLYHQLAALPLPELLDLLDVTYHSLKKIFMNYHAPNTLSWLAKYWWVPPVATTALTYTIFKWYISRTKSVITD